MTSWTIIGFLKEGFFIELIVGISPTQFSCWLLYQVYMWEE